MRRLSLPLCISSAILLVAPVLLAQGPDVTTPRAGAWGAELVYGGTSAASLLHFSTPTRAWLLGIAGYAASEHQDVPFPGGYTTDTRLDGGVWGRVGARWWGGDRTSRIRPLTGLGLTGGIFGSPSRRSWNAGVYGELGAGYFFSPHLSLSASGELLAAHSRDRSASGSPTIPDPVTRRWLLRGDLARLGAAVYF